LKVAIIPGFSLLKIIVDPGEKVKDIVPATVMPWLYAPWPEARKRGVIEAEVSGETLRGLLVELADRYRRAGVDIEPVESGKDEVNEEYYIYVNGQEYNTLAEGLDTYLAAGDEVVVDMTWYPD